MYILFFVRVHYWHWPLGSCTMVYALLFPYFLHFLSCICISLFMIFLLYQDYCVRLSLTFPTFQCSILSWYILISFLLLYLVLHGYCKAIVYLRLMSDSIFFSNSVNCVYAAIYNFMSSMYMRLCTVCPWMFLYCICILYRLKDLIMVSCKCITINL